MVDGFEGRHVDRGDGHKHPALQPGSEPVSLAPPPHTGSVVGPGAHEWTFWGHHPAPMPGNQPHMQRMADYHAHAPPDMPTLRRSEHYAMPNGAGGQQYGMTGQHIDPAVRNGAQADNAAAHHASVAQHGAYAQYAALAAEQQAQAIAAQQFTSMVASAAAAGAMAAIQKLAPSGSAPSSADAHATFMTAAHAAAMSAAASARELLPGGAACMPSAYQPHPHMSALMHDGAPGAMPQMHPGAAAPQAPPNGGTHQVPQAQAPAAASARRPDAPHTSGAPATSAPANGMAPPAGRWTLAESAQDASVPKPLTPYEDSLVKNIQMFAWLVGPNGRHTLQQSLTEISDRYSKQQMVATAAPPPQGDARSAAQHAAPLDSDRSQLAARANTSGPAARPSAGPSHQQSLPPQWHQQGQPAALHSAEQAGGAYAPGWVMQQQFNGHSAGMHAPWTAADRVSHPSAMPPGAMGGPWNGMAPGHHQSHYMHPQGAPYQQMQPGQPGPTSLHTQQHQVPAQQMQMQMHQQQAMMPQPQQRQPSGQQQYPPGAHVHQQQQPQRANAQQAAQVNAQASEAMFATQKGGMGNVDVAQAAQVPAPAVDSTLRNGPLPAVVSVAPAVPAATPVGLPLASTPPPGGWAAQEQWQAAGGRAHHASRSGSGHLDNGQEQEDQARPAGDRGALEAGAARAADAAEQWANGGTTTSQPLDEARLPPRHQSSSQFQVSGKSEQNLSAMFDNSMEEDGMSMLDMDNGMNLDNATMADSMVGGLWPGDDAALAAPGMRGDA